MLRNSDVLTLVYKYGAKTPTENLDIAQEELDLRTKLWNELVAIEEDYLFNYRAILRTSYDDDIEALQTRIAQLEELISVHKADAAYRTIQLGQAHEAAVEIQKAAIEALEKYKIPELTEKKKKYKSIPLLLFAAFESYNDAKKAVKQLRSQLKPLFAAAKAERKTLKKRFKNDLEILNDIRLMAVKKARQESGLYWGNYNDVIASYHISHKQIMRYNRNMHRQTPNGTGKITVQFQHGIRPNQLFERNNLLELEPVSDHAWDKQLGRRRKKMQWTMAKIRIRSDAEKNPIWLKFPVCIHRPIPKDAKIQTASVVFTKVGNRFEYSLNLTLNLPQPKPMPKNRPSAEVEFYCTSLEDGGLHVASITPDRRVNLSSRIKKNQVLSQVIRREKGQLKVVIPQYTISQFAKIRSLRRLEDEYQNEAKKAIVNLRDKQPVPGWFTENTQTIEAIKASEPFKSLFRIWRNRRFKGDSEAFNALATYVERHNHLYSWQFNLRQQIQERRRDMFRNVAALLGQNFKKLTIQEIPFWQGTHAGKKSQFDSAVRNIRRNAARSILRMDIINTAKRCGVEVVDLKEQTL